MLTQTTSKISSLALASLVATALSGCGAFETKHKGEKAKENDNHLSGEWQDGCTTADWLGFAYQRESLTFSAVGDFDRVTTLYKDEACQAAVGTLTEHGTYSALGASAEVANADDINFQVNEASVKVDDDGAVKLLNDASYCDLSWQKGQEQSILDKSCLGINHKKGEVVFDIYNVDTNANVLKLGKTSLFTNKAAADDRPARLDEAHPYSKVD
jgi:hypothetical protein